MRESSTTIASARRDAELARARAGRSPGRASWPARRRRRRRRSRAAVVGADDVLEHRADRLLGRGRGDGERPAGGERLVDDPGDPGAAGQPAGAHDLLVDRGLALVQRRAIRSRSRVGVGEERRDPLLAAADPQPLGRTPPRPSHGQAGLGERLVERGPVAVALGVGEHAVAVEDERGHAVRRPRSRTPAPCPPTRRCGCGAPPCPSPPSRTCLSSDGGSCLPGFASRYSRCASTNAIFSAVEMLTFAQPRAIRSVNCASVRPGAAVQDHRDRMLLDDLGDALGHQLRLGLVEAVRGADRRRERVDAGRGDELAPRPRPDGPRRRPRSRPRPRRRSRSRSRPRPGRRSASASATTSIVWRVFSATSSSEPSNSTEFQPASQAGRDPLAVRAVVEVQRHRDGHRVRPRAPHRVQRPGADRLHRLERRLDDQRRLELGRRGEHRLEREVVDDVDRRHAVALRERAIEDLTHRHDRHRTGTPLVGLHGRSRRDAPDCGPSRDAIDIANSSQSLSGATFAARTRGGGCASLAAGMGEPPWLPWWTPTSEECDERLRGRESGDRRDAQDVSDDRRRRAATRRSGARTPLTASGRVRRRSRSAPGFSGAWASCYGEQRQRLGEIIVREMGKPIEQAVGEVDFSVDDLRVLRRQRGVAARGRADRARRRRGLGLRAPQLGRRAARHHAVELPLLPGGALRRPEPGDREHDPAQARAAVPRVGGGDGGDLPAGRLPGGRVHQHLRDQRADRGR